MELIFTGSGCGIPSLEKSAPGIVIQSGNESLLFDSGSGTLARLLHVGINYTQLNHVFYTHLHSDHTADLVPFIQALKTTPDYFRKKELNLYGPVGFHAFLDSLARIYGEWLIHPEYPLKIHELSDTTIELASWFIQTRPMKHGKTAIGYRVESESGKSIVYSGDTDFCPEIIELGKNADILILECSFTDDNKKTGHLTPSEAGKIASEADCKHLILTHLYPPYEIIESEINEKIPRLYHGEVTIASDFLKIKI